MAVFLVASAQFSFDLNSLLIYWKTSEEKANAELHSKLNFLFLQQTLIYNPSNHCWCLHSKILLCKWVIYLFLDNSSLTFSCLEVNGINSLCVEFGSFEQHISSEISHVSILNGFGSATWRQCNIILNHTHHSAFGFIIMQIPFKSRARMERGCCVLASGRFLL